MARRKAQGEVVQGDASTVRGDDSAIPKNKGKRENTGARKEDNLGGAGIGILDVLRVLAGGILLSCALSWVITGESVLWGYRPWYTKVGDIRAWLKGPLYLTDQQLAAYDGSDPTKPIYVGLNGTIYDVTAGRRIYGPGGSYHFFAGRDAARAFITGCFQEDLTADLRGVEELYIPRDLDVSSSSDDPSALHNGPAEVEQDGKLIRKGGKQGVSKAELKIKREQAKRLAKKKVHAAIDSWHKTYLGEKGNKGYFKVGYIKREPGWLEKLPQRKLCKQAEDSRPKTTLPDPKD